MDCVVRGLCGTWTVWYVDCLVCGLFGTWTVWYVLILISQNNRKIMLYPDTYSVQRVLSYMIFVTM